MNSRKKNKLVYTVLTFICILGFWYFDNFYTPNTYSDTATEPLKTDLPNYVLPTSTSGHIVRHNYYTLSYKESYEQAEWVAYVLKKSHLTYDDRKRPYFIEDPWVATKSADWRNYKGSGYDRGHLCPAGDRRFSKQAYDETFYTSNISPQNNTFNAGIWNRLEKKVRKWAKQYNEIVVITGGILEPGLVEIGVEDVGVPRTYYKIVARGNKHNLKVIGFLMNAKESQRPLNEFVVSIDEIEQRTGIDFFSKLSDGLEDKLESDLRIANWKF